MAVLTLFVLTAAIGALLKFLAGLFCAAGYRRVRISNIALRLAGVAVGVEAPSIPYHYLALANDPGRLPLYLNRSDVESTFSMVKRKYEDNFSVTTHNGPPDIEVGRGPSGSLPIGFFICGSSHGSTIIAPNHSPPTVG